MDERGGATAGLAAQEVSPGRGVTLTSSLHISHTRKALTLAQVRAAWV
eukprot:COSAG02_NODE_3441_length_6735_cov_38.359233_4_plen_47_part_01